MASGLKMSQTEPWDTGRPPSCMKPCRRMEALRRSTDISFLTRGNKMNTLNTFQNINCRKINSNDVSTRACSTQSTLYEEQNCTSERSVRSNDVLVESSDRTDRRNQDEKIRNERELKRQSRSGKERELCKEKGSNYYSRSRGRSRSHERSRSSRESSRTRTDRNTSNSVMGVDHKDTRRSRSKDRRDGESWEKGQYRKSANRELHDKGKALAGGTERTAKAVAGERRVSWVYDAANSCWVPQSRFGNDRNLTSVAPLNSDPTELQNKRADESSPFWVREEYFSRELSIRKSWPVQESLIEESASFNECTRVQTGFFLSKQEHMYPAPLSSSEPKTTPNNIIIYNTPSQNLNPPAHSLDSLPEDNASSRTRQFSHYPPSPKPPKQDTSTSGIHEEDNVESSGPLSSLLALTNEGFKISRSFSPSSFASMTPPEALSENEECDNKEPSDMDWYSVSSAEGIESNSCDDLKSQVPRFEAIKVPELITSSRLRHGPVKVSIFPESGRAVAMVKPQSRQRKSSESDSSSSSVEFVGCISKDVKRVMPIKTNLKFVVPTANNILPSKSNVFTAFGDSSCEDEAPQEPEMKSAAKKRYFPSPILKNSDSPGETENEHGKPIPTFLSTVRRRNVQEGDDCYSNTPVDMGPYEGPECDANDGTYYQNDQRNFSGSSGDLINFGNNAPWLPSQGSESYYYNSGNTSQASWGSVQHSWTPGSGPPIAQDGSQYWQNNISGEPQQYYYQKASIFPNNHGGHI